MGSPALVALTVPLRPVLSCAGCPALTLASGRCGRSPCVCVYSLNVTHQRPVTSLSAAYFVLIFVFSNSRTQQ